MEDRCICCGEIIPEGRQVCKECQEGGGSRMMKNGSGAAVPTEEAAMRNIAKENHRYVEEMFDCIEPVSYTHLDVYKRQMHTVGRQL